MSTTVSPRSRRAVLRFGAMTFGGALLLAACGGADYEQSAEELIEGELADTVGLGAVEATCEQPDGGEAAADGDTFTCTATTESGEVVNYVATANGDTVEVETTNVIVGANMGEVERITAESLTQQIGVELPAANVDCGEASVVVAGDTILTCALTDPETDDVYDVELSNIDITAGDGAVTFDILVADAPRG